VAEHTAGAALPELGAVPWRDREGAESLERRGSFWTAWTALQVIPFLVASALLIALEPLSAPVALAAIAHAWIIPELYAFRGVNVLNPKGPRNEAGAGAARRPARPRPTRAPARHRTGARARAARDLARG
jgi:hypothetical protein